MAVKETLDLDIRRALAQASQLSAALDKGLTGAAEGFEQSITQATSKLGSVSTGPIANIGTGLKAAGQEAQQAGAHFAQLGPEADKAAAAFYGYQTSVAKAREEERLANQQRTETEQSLKRVGTAAGIAAAAIGVGLGLAINASMDFERQISMVGAVSGASAAQMDRLRDAAITAGQATVFSASQAAEAETELAKAGISVADILGGALAGALDLAAAGQLDLGRAAEIAAQAMTTFGLKGSDVAHIADVLAAGANKSTASVESLAQGLENVGGVAAKLFNISLEETVGTLAAFDQNALRGAEGGTALRSALLSLATPTKQQAELMAQIAEQTGVQVNQFSSLSELAGNLQTAFAGMDDAQRRYALGVLFGSYGIRAANILYQEGAEGIAKWTGKVNDAGAAQAFASQALDNLAGDLEQLRGSIETGLIGAGSQGNEVLRFMAQRATEAVNGLAQLPGPIQAAGFGLAGIAAAGLSAVFVIGSLAPKWRKTADALRNMGSAGTFAADNMGKIARIGAGLAGAVISFQMIGQSAEASAIGIAGMAASGALIGSTFGPQGTAIGAAVGGIAGLTKALLDSGESAEELRSRMTRLANDLDELGNKASAGKFLDESLSSIGDVLDVAKGNVSAFRQEFRALAAESPANAAKVLEGLKQMRDESGKPLFSEDQIALLEKALERGGEAFKKHAANARDANAADQELASGLPAVADAADAAASAWEGYTKALSDGVPSVQDAFSRAVSATQDFADANDAAFDPQVFLSKLQEQLDGIRDWSANVRFFAEQGFSDLAAHFAQLGPEAGGIAAKGLRDAGPEVQAAANDMLGGIQTETDNVAAWLAGPGAEAMRNSAYAMGFGVGPGVGEGIGAGQPAASSAAGALAAASADALNSGAGTWGAIGAYGAGVFSGGLASGTGQASGAGSAVAAAGAAALEGIVPAGARSGAAGGFSWSNALSGTAPQASGAGATVWSSAAAALGADTSGLGAAFGDGFANGIWGSIGRVTAAAAAVASAAKAAVVNWLDSRSPSRVMIGVGQDFSAGLAIGIDDGTSGVTESATSVADAATQIVMSKLSAEQIATESARRIAENESMGINVGLAPIPEGFVSAPVGVRSSALWTQEMVEAFDAARSQDGTSPPGDSASPASPASPSDGSTEVAGVFRDILVAVQASAEADKAWADVVSAGPLPVEVVKLPEQRPSVSIGEISIVNQLPAGSPGDVVAAAGAATQGAVLDALGQVGVVTVRSATSTIKAL